MFIIIEQEAWWVCIDIFIVSFIGGVFLLKKKNFKKLAGPVLVGLVIVDDVDIGQSSNGAVCVREVLC